MRGRLGRAAIAATILSVVLIPAVGSLADPESELSKTKERLDEIRSRIERTEAEAGSVKARVDELNRQILALRNEVARLDATIARIESEVRSAQARIDATQAKMDKIEARAMQQAVALYKSGSTDVIDLLLNSESLTQLDERAEFLGVAAQQNTDALIQYGRLNLEIQAQHRELFNKKRQLMSEQKSREEALALLDDRHARLATELRALQDKLGRQYAIEGDLEDKAEALTAEIINAQAGFDAAARGISNQGFIWPLNGNITSYFGPRWGRMHTGIDIDGTTGQPIVASKAGRVILAQYYSGYGNAVIIDHGGGIATLYAHMSRFNTSVGSIVSQGQVVGYVGCTGSCTGDHLHFEVRVNGEPVDPLNYLP
jgi:murein DD-endopeptidase MepM/ murein hydrolase activator NlpD